MEISRVAASSPASVPMLGVRAARSAGEFDGVRAANDALAQRAGRDRAEQATQSRAESLRQVREKDAAPEVRDNFAGSIEFEVVEEAKVMKVLDSKDVLIYQMPSKGQLALIKAQEAAERRAGVEA